MKQQKVIRVRFKKGGGRFGRPVRIVKFTESGKELLTYYRKYNPNKHFSKDLDPNDFITEWKRGPTPMPKPFRNCSDTELKAAGYKEEQFAELRGRKYSAKDVCKLRKALGGTKKVTGDEARVILDEHGSYHKACVAKESEIDAVKKRREEAQENVIHMGKFTHKIKKSKKPRTSQKDLEKERMRIHKKARKKAAGTGF